MESSHPSSFSVSFYFTKVLKVVKLSVALSYFLPVLLPDQAAAGHRTVPDLCHRVQAGISCLLRTPATPG
jgi:hypothetical protein